MGRRTRRPHYLAKLDDYFDIDSVHGEPGDDYALDYYMKEWTQRIGKELANKNSQFFGKWVVRLRQRLGMSRTELARELGVNRTTVFRWEKGKVLPNGRAVWRMEYINAIWEIGYKAGKAEYQNKGG